MQSLRNLVSYFWFYEIKCHYFIIYFVFFVFSTDKSSKLYNIDLKSIGTVFLQLTTIQGQQLTCTRPLWENVRSTLVSRDLFLFVRKDVDHASQRNKSCSLVFWRLGQCWSSMLYTSSGSYKGMINFSLTLLSV